MKKFFLALAASTVLIATAAHACNHRMCTGVQRIVDGSPEHILVGAVSEPSFYDPVIFDDTVAFFQWPMCYKWRNKSCKHY